ncbi:endonuclease/exonuclease/phosphatase family metal-dependent hydrolase [Thermosporothrix hazakensis]|jgi:endonuclease/exonuclease/phosphatase family metal-dependent hydrolase|uniref:Endonuclease/exonuclease/phosphatase family metal-dependent hydrolase n=2 Tax=Thermosporothrix TaxID=768650 RepID=A0A326UAX6_THEHA|nr:endonuclease/exonuclease/phosphatase family protein [Thermosporothrix hazakensis]PZW32828.1 endonuclease/exonuclease/phosphatase family metal-dependent hydrolase [Thermosporothrix hazakensis]BBH90809.1 hypothetical protein KTC_55600 [Thermosporothrix sp. COM3]GCE48859.1 hypothetical protein KTH_37280 [Thermosporothrix hazakensis]
MTLFTTLLQKHRFKAFTIATYVYFGLLILLLLLQSILQQRDGVLALFSIFAPYLFIPFLLLFPFLFFRQTAFLRIVFLLAILVFGLLYSPHLAFGAGAAGEKPITVLTWNFLGNNARSGSLRHVLNTEQPQIVALQEADWRGIDMADDVLTRYPYHLYRPDQGVPPGEVLLSTYPILDYGEVEAPDGSRAIWDIPRILWARLDLGQGRTLFVVNAHPISAVNTVYGCTFCPKRRDSQIQELQKFIQSHLKQGEHVLLLGDMNTTDREVAYKDLSNGLQDMHRLVGNGSGHSWGLRQLNRFWALLRIDYMFASPNIQPLSLKTDCSSRGSDHCVLIGQITLK